MSSFTCLAIHYLPNFLYCKCRLSPLLTCLQSNLLTCLPKSLPTYLATSSYTYAGVSSPVCWSACLSVCLNFSYLSLYLSVYLHCNLPFVKFTCLALSLSPLLALLTHLPARFFFPYLSTNLSIHRVMYLCFKSTITCLPASLPAYLYLFPRYLTRQPASLPFLASYMSTYFTWPLSSHLSQCSACVSRYLIGCLLACVFACSSSYRPTCLPPNPLSFFLLLYLSANCHPIWLFACLPVQRNTTQHCPLHVGRCCGVL